ncbi:MAG: flagellar filament capping protein FliD, partial [Thermodesulfobacteriota bacterium]|nr:flagellar filament capping protein FliD [Thermodesulfobacteriota bacterium]
KSEWDEKVTAFQDLNSTMLTLKTALEGMDTMNEFLAKTTTSSDSDVATATADSSAQTVSHSIEINQLAANDIFMGSHAFSAETSVVNNTSGASQFNYTYGTTTISNSVAAGTTLTGLVNQINNDPSNPGVRAGIIKVEDNDYRLQIRGLDLGADYQFSIEGSTTLSNAGAGNFTETQNAVDAEFKVDGFPAGAGDWISRASNTVTDVVEGLTISLKGVGTANIVTNVDNDAVKEQVRTFVDKTNEVRSLILELTEFDETTEEGSILTGNYGVQMISSKLKSITSTKGLGFDYDDDTLSVLSQLGITTDAEKGSLTFGLLLLDEETLDEALTADPDAVAQIFSADFIGDTDSTDFGYYSYVDGITKAGEYSVAYQVDAAGDIVAGSAYINGHAASIDNTTKQITGTYGYDEAGIVVQVVDTAVGSYSGNVRLKQGKAGEMAELLQDLTSASTGPLHILEDNYQEIMDNIDEKIDDEWVRLERMERDLRNKYARLEALLGTYEGISDNLENQLTQLDT